MSILSGIATVTSILSLLKKDKNADNARAIGQAIGNALPRNLNISDSYISFTKPFVINPITIIDESLQYDEGLPAILSTANLVFASYYTLALQADSVLGSATVRSKLDKFNPDRQVSLSMEDLAVSMENFEGGLPSLEKELIYSPESIIDPKDPYSRATRDSVNDIARAIEKDEELKRKNEREDAKDARQVELNRREDAKYARQVELNRREDERYAAEMNKSSTMVKDITPRENKNLFLGRTYGITLQEGLQTLEVSVVIRLMSSVIDQESLAHMLSLGKYAFSAKDRLMRLRTGSLSLADIFLCRDILDAHRSALRNDKSGIYHEITSRGLKNAGAALKSGHASVGTNSGIAVISSDTARDIEFKIGDKLSKPSTRDRLFKALNLMILFVYDPAYGQVVMYQRGLNYATETTIRELKSGTDKVDKAADVTDLFKRIAAGDKLF